MSDIKKVIRQEYLKCAADPIHFMKKYCFIQHPQRGRIQFSLFPFQEKLGGYFHQVGFLPRLTHEMLCMPSKSLK